MKAFLSHSGSDKSLVKEVFALLGAGQAIYDSDAFRSGSSTAELMDRLLPAADLFVLFWSAHAVHAKGVEYEIEALRLETQRRDLPTLIVSIDGEPYSTLPKWLRHNYVEELQSAPIIARRIQSRLMALRGESGINEVFINRTVELSEIEAILAAPTDEMPVAIAVCGWEGIGRRALVKRAVRNIYPTARAPFPTAALQSTESAPDFYRKLIDLTERPTVERWVELTSTFEASDREHRIQLLAERVETLRNAGELLLLIDEGGIVADNNKYHRWFSAFLKAIERSTRPAVAIMQQRASSITNQEQHPSVAFLRVGSLDDHHAQSLLGSLFKQHNLRFTRAQLDDLATFIGGHPADLHHAARFAQRRGVDALTKDKTSFRNATAKHSIDILARLDLDLQHFLAASVVRDFRLVSTDDLLELLAMTPDSVMQSIGHAVDWASTVEGLEQYSILERWAGYVRLAPFLVDAFARHLSSRPPEITDNVDAAQAVYGAAMLELASKRTEGHTVPLATMESGLLASLRTSNRPEWIRQLFLPSHLLHLARECYDAREHAKAVKLVREALARQSLLTGDARSEANRLLAMALIRLGHSKEADEPVSELIALGSNTAKRNAHFILGFRARISGDYDRAEEEFRLSLGYGPRNLHALRELAHVLHVQRRYTEAENFARSAYGVAPSNPFVLDVFCAVLIGKPRTPIAIQADSELSGLLNELGRQDELQGTSFYASRLSQYFAAIGQPDKAMQYANEAVQRTRRPPMAALLGLVERAIEVGAFDLTRQTLRTAKKQAAESRTDRSHWPRILELEILVSIRTGDFNGALRTLKDNGRSLPMSLQSRLLTQAQEAMAERPSIDIDPALRKWLAKAPSPVKLTHAKPPSRPSSTRRRKAGARTMPPAVAALRQGQAVSGRVAGKSRTAVFVEVLGYDGIVPKRFVDANLRNAAIGQEGQFIVHEVDPKRPSLVLRPVWRLPA